jgi:hypothetical protein
MSEPPRRGNGGIVSNAVTDVVDVFRNSPSLLFIMLLNVMFLGGLGYMLIYISERISERRTAEFNYITSTMDRRYDELMGVCFRELREIRELKKQELEDKR